MAKSVIDDQERRLLRERTAEIATVYTIAVSSVQASLRSAAAVAAVTNADPRRFSTYASSLLVSKANPAGYAALALVATGGSSPRLLTSVGTGISAARLSDPEVNRTLMRAKAASFVSTRVLGTGTDLRLGFALGPPDAPAGHVVYAEQVLNPFATVDAPRTAATPFSELIGAIYSSETADPSQVLVSNVRRVPLTGDVGRQTIDVGPDKWLVEIQPRTSLVGAAASTLPWILVGLGIALSIVITTVVEVLGRRRRYAEAVVEERTRELRDSIGQLERAQQQLVLSERLAAIGQVASTVGHELRNPLGVMANAIYLLRLRIDEPDSTRHLDTLEREVASAARISSDLLDFARLREPEWASVDLDELVDESLAIVARPSGVDLIRPESNPVGVVRADRDQLRQVLVNLLSNAYEALEHSGTVTVSTQRVDGAVRIEVADDGPGMDESTRERMYEPFFTTKTRGTGLGLPVCKRLVEAHGGSLTVASAPGQGTRFTIVLPKVPAAAPRPADALTSGSAGALT